jgi:hypothetical protein
MSNKKYREGWMFYHINIPIQNILIVTWSHETVPIEDKISSFNCKSHCPTDTITEG